MRHGVVLACAVAACTPTSAPPAAIANAARPAPAASRAIWHRELIADVPPAGVRDAIARDYELRDEVLAEPRSLVPYPIDLDGDGTHEWFVHDTGFSGTGASLDYIVQRQGRGWHVIGRLDGLDVISFGPDRIHGYRSIHGKRSGVCATGNGIAEWDGSRYVLREVSHGVDPRCR